MKQRALLSRVSDEWTTPKYIYDQAIKKGMFDPCPLGGNVDGLRLDWGASNFVNPPYSKLRKWVEKSINEHMKGKSVTLLIPARTDTKSFKLLYEYGSDITFISGLLRFSEAGPAPFPSMLVELNGGGATETRFKLIGKDDVKI